MSPFALYYTIFFLSSAMGYTNWGVARSVALDRVAQYERRWGPAALRHAYNFAEEELRR